MDPRQSNGAIFLHKKSIDQSSIKTDKRDVFEPAEEHINQLVF